MSDGNTAFNALMYADQKPMTEIFSAPARPLRARKGFGRRRAAGADGHAVAHRRRITSLWILGVTMS